MIKYDKDGYLNGSHEEFILFRFKRFPYASRCGSCTFQGIGKSGNGKLPMDCKLEDDHVAQCSGFEMRKELTSANKKLLKKFKKHLTNR